MPIGQPGDRFSLARVFVAMVLGGVVLGAAGYLFDLVVGRLIGMGGWWTVFFHGGLIVGAAAQGLREFATPRPAEREALAAEARARATAGPADGTEQP
ncbi:MAG: hypothetical protein M3O34_12280 [Chloroflexota bacterium]|nr:hypothetical protein [Chloroflexota bacterium]